MRHFVRLIGLLLAVAPGVAWGQVSPLPPIIGGVVNLSGVTVRAGNLAVTLGLTVTQSADTSTASSDSRNVLLSTTLSPTVNTGNIWENDNSFVYINGPGQQQGEVNLAHSYLEVEVGANATQVEDYEASMENFGTIGAFDDYLAISHNASTGTVSYINGVTGYLVNDNTTAGSVGVYQMFDCEPMQGAGAQPSASYCVRNADSHQTIATLGGLHVGSLGTSSAGTAEVDGPDTSSGTFPLMIKNSAGTILFAISDSGNIVGYNATFGVSCAAGTVSLTTLTITNGLVTHC